MVRLGRKDLNSKTKTCTFILGLSWLFFFVVVRPPVFWLWEGSITPPGPAMVRLDRKDLNSKTKNHARIWILSDIRAAFLWWFAHLCYSLGRGPIAPPGPVVFLMNRRDLNSKTNTTGFCAIPGMIVYNACPDITGFCSYTLLARCQISTECDLACLHSPLLWEIWPLFRPKTSRRSWS